MTKRDTRKRRLFFGLFVLIILLAIPIDCLVESRYPSLTVYRVAVPNLPQQLDGLRIVQLSDVHRLSPSCDPVIRRAVKLANSTKPDIAVFTGDFAGQDLANYDPCLKLLSEVKTKRGSYAVLGNHDHWANADFVREAIRRHGIHLLDNANEEIADGVFLAGIDDPWWGKPAAGRALRGIGASHCCVMLAHSPMAAGLFSGRKGLLVTGHTHGGQVQIPFVARNRLPGLKGFPYVEGWYPKGGLLTFVSRGVGMVPPAVRFRCRSQVVLFVLHPGKDASVVR